MPRTPGLVRMIWCTRSTTSSLGACPSSGFTVSRTSRRPLTSTNAPTARPTQPSSRTPVAHETIEQARTALVVMTSLRESTAVASRVSDSMRRPSVRLKAISQAFIAIETSMTATSGRPNETSRGSRMRSMPERTSSTPTEVTSTATTRPARYSKRP